jgi:glycine oxidase
MPAQGWLERPAAPPAAAMNPKTHQQRFDALIVGGGVIGIACAWRAARRGLSVCVLEREQQVASGASGVAAGMLAPVGELSWGEEALLALGLASMRLWDGFAAELEADSGISAGYRRCGSLRLALDRDETEELQRRHRLHQQLGLESEWLLPSACRALEPGLATNVAAGVHVPHEGAADPVALCEALAAALPSRGGVLELGAEVAAAEPERTGWLLRLADGRELHGERLVVAAGCWSGAAGWLPAALRTPVRPVKGEILTLRGAAGSPACERIVASERVYLVPRDDGRLMVGATVEDKGFDLTVTAGGVHELLREAYRVLPEIAELELLEARAGLRPGTPDNAPIIGRSGDRGDQRAIVATGHYRNGILLAPVTAEAVAALLADERPAVEIEPFRPGRFDGAAPGGPPPPAEAVAR